jgi:capsule biosynthesis phosphatase
MIRKERCIVMDLDGTLCRIRKADEDYADVSPNQAVIERLREFRAEGFYIIITTSRTMRTFDGNLGLINAHTAETALQWLRQHDVPFDEIYFGKPWPGRGGFYVDDKTVRPDEFASMSYEQIRRLVGDE